MPPQVNNLESRAMRVLATAEPTFRQLLKGICLTSSTSKLRMFLDLLTERWLLPSRALPVEQEENPMWYDILTVTPAKQTLWLRRVDGKYNAAMRALERRQFQMHVPEAFQDGNAELVWRIACCFFCAMKALPNVMTSAAWSQNKRLFLKGELDNFFIDKCSLLDPGFQFGELQFIRNVVRGEATVPEAERRNILQSDLNLARVKLLGEQLVWAEHTAKNKAIKARQTEEICALAEANAALEKAVDRHLMSHYQAACGCDMDVLRKAAEEHMQTFAGIRDHSSVYCVHICNMAALGQSWAVHFNRMVEHASNAMAANPKKSVALFFLPNCAGHCESLQEAVTDVVVTLKNQALTKMLVKEVVAIFDDRDNEWGDRSRRADFVMCISEKRDPAGMLLCEFAKSALWRFEAVPSLVPMHPVSEARDWNMTLNGAGHDFYGAGGRHQWLSGEGFYQEILSALFDGVYKSIALGNLGHVKEWTLYDDTLGQAVLKLNASRTTRGLPLLGWCGLTHSHIPKVGAGVVIQSMVMTGLRDKIIAMSKNNTYVIPGFSPTLAIPMSSTSSTSLPAHTFELCCPEGHHLPVKQIVVDELMEKARLLDEGDAVQQLKMWLAEHNEKVNPSGKNWCTNAKRPPEVATTDLPEARAVVITSREGHTSTMEELRHPSRGKTRELACGDYSLIASMGELWLVANQDTVISDLDPLLQVCGKYEVDDVARDVMAKKTCWLNFSLTEQTLVTSDALTSPIVPVNSLLAKLEVLGRRNIKLWCHTVTSLCLSYCQHPHTNQSKLRQYGRCLQSHARRCSVLAGGPPIH